MEEYAQCPYNKTHHILRKNFQVHILKCRKNNPNSEIQICPFNAIHHIPEKQFMLHLLTCEDRTLTSVDTSGNGATTLENSEYRKSLESEENWDDTDVVEYNPKEYLKKAPVLRHTDRLKPTLRKAFTQKYSKQYNIPPPPPIIRYTNLHNSNGAVNVYNDDGETHRNSPPPPPKGCNWNI